MAPIPAKVPQSVTHILEPAPVKQWKTRNRSVLLVRTATILLFLLMLLIGCAAPSKDLAMVQISPAAYPYFADDMAYDGLSDSIQQTLTYLHKLPQDREFIFGADKYTTAHLIRSFELFLAFIDSKPSEKEMRSFIKTHYRVYRSVGKGRKGEVLFTGYYEPFLSGSAEETEAYPYPILTLPKDLVSIDLSLFSPKYNGESIMGRLAGRAVVPYYDRREIVDDRVLYGQTEVLCWLKDPVDLFFLQIQGSGRVFLEDGRILHVHYHGANGRPYRSIGRLLIDEGKIAREEMSMQRIRTYLSEHPEELDDILNYNPSYVFFKTESDGPLGYLEVKLTPGRSIALDRRIFPLPALAFINTQKPLINGEGNIYKWVNFARFTVSQDTGGAIRGPARSDLFWGNGTYAEIAAGHMQHNGRLYMLVLKPESASQPGDE